MTRSPKLSCIVKTAAPEYQRLFLAAICIGIVVATGIVLWASSPVILPYLTPINTFAVMELGIAGFILFGAADASPERTKSNEPAFEYVFVPLIIQGIAIFLYLPAAMCVAAASNEWHTSMQASGIALLEIFVITAVGTTFLIPIARAYSLCKEKKDEPAE